MMRKDFAMQKPWLGGSETRSNVSLVDPIWDQVRREGEESSAREPVLASRIYAIVTSERKLEDAV